MANQTYWRNIYKSISGYSQSVTQEYVYDILESVGNDLLLGLQMFKPYTPASFKKWHKNLPNKDNQLVSIVQRISRTLSMDSEQAYKIFCNFLMFEYHGKVKDIGKISKLDTHLRRLLKNIWHFYSMERKFYLKTLRIVIENFDNQNHPYYQAFNKLLRNLTEVKIKESLFGQLKLLTTESFAHDSTTSVVLKDWVTRSYAEQLEILSIITMFANKVEFTVDEVVELVETFKKNGFGLQPPDFYDPILTSTKGTLQNIFDLENLTILITTKHLFTDSTFVNTYKKLEETFAAIDDFSSDLPIISLGWSLLLISLPEDSLDGNYKLHLPQLLTNLLKSGVLGHIETILRKPFLLDTCLGNIIKEALGIYYDKLAKIFDPIFLYKVPGSIDLLASILKIKDLAKSIVDPVNPINKVFSLGINLFPWDYLSVTKFCSSFLEHPEFHQQVFDCLQNIQYFSEETNAELLQNLKNPEPIQGLNIQSKINSLVFPVQPKKVLQCRGGFSYSYFYFLEDQVYCTVATFAKEGNYCSRDITMCSNRGQFLEFTLEGLELLAKILDIKNGVWDDPHVALIIQHVTVLVSQVEVHNDCFKNIMSACLKICTILLRVRPEHIIQMLLNSRCLPSTFSLHKEFKVFSYMDVSKTASILQIILQQKVYGEYSLLFSYLDFIKSCLKNEYELEKLQVPNLVFILHDVFPHHLTWKYSDVFDCHKLSMEILSYLFNLITFCSENVESVQVHCYNFCMDTLMNHDAFIETFNVIMRFSNTRLEEMMYQEVNWENGKTLYIVKAIKMCLCITLWMFSAKSGTLLKETKFWKRLFFSAPRYINILKIICDYINYKFEPILPKLACSLLKKISNDSSILVLANLQMDNYQVQSMFLERLRDPIENVELKVTLLEMITTCLNTQNGMTAAFFNLIIKSNSTENTEETDTGDTLIDYMQEYLDNISTYPENLKLPVQATILKLFHTLWTKKKTGLVKSLAEKNQFWQTVFVPLAKKSELHSSTYMELLDILGLELFEKDCQMSLLKELQLILKNEPDVLIQFSSFLVTHYVLEKRDGLSFELFVSWHRFLFILLHSRSNIIPCELRHQLFFGICEAFLKILTKDDYDMKVVIVFIDICLFFAEQWPLNCFETDENLLAIGQIYYYLSQVYDPLPRNSREDLISIAIYILDSPNLAKRNLDKLKPFLTGIFLMITEEFRSINSKSKYGDCKVWMGALMFVKRLIALKICNEYIYGIRFKDKVMFLTSFFVTQNETMPVAKISLQFLKFYVSAVPTTFLLSDFNTLYLSLKWPQHLLDYDYEQLEIMNPSYFEEFWLAYNAMIQFNINLIRVYKEKVFNSITLFLTINKFDLLKLMKLLEKTVDMCALKLISGILTLCNNFVNPENVCFNEDREFIDLYQKSLPVCLDTAIDILLRPQSLKFYHWDVNLKITFAEYIPTINFAHIMDRMVEIIMHSALGLVNIFPTIAKIFGIKKLGNPNFIEFLHDFAIPNSMEWPTVKLGGLICVVQYLCKVIQQDFMVNKPEPVTPFMSTTMHAPYFLEPKDQNEKPKKFFSLVHPNQVDAISYDKLSSIQRFANSDVYSLMAPWLQSMHKRFVLPALELLNTLLANHMLKAIKERPYDKQVKVMQRDLSSEMQFFHDFVRKTLVEQQKYMFDGNKIIINKNIKGGKHDDNDFNDYIAMLSHWFSEYGDISS